MTISIFYKKDNHRYFSLNYIKKKTKRRKLNQQHIIKKKRKESGMKDHKDHKQRTIWLIKSFNQSNNGWPIKNDGLSILWISLSIFDALIWVFFQKIARWILYKIQWKEFFQSIIEKPYSVSNITFQKGILSNVLFYKRNYFSFSY
jgi:hypothetical protein